MNLSDIMISFRGLKREIEVCKWSTLTTEHITRHNQLAGLLLEYVDLSSDEIILDITASHQVDNYLEILTFCLESGEEKEAECVWELMGDLDYTKSSLIPVEDIAVVCPKCGGTAYVFPDPSRYYAVGAAWWKVNAKCAEESKEGREVCGHTFPLEYRIVAKLEVRDPE